MTGLWKITKKGTIKVPETSPKKEELLEANLEEWINKDPSIIGEPLLILGRQVKIHDTKDRLDLLAVDPQGNSVIIEIKRGKLKDPVDMQALRYASYISKWKLEDLETVFYNNRGKADDSDYNFNSVFESFCKEVGVDEVPVSINENQRIIIVGSSVRDKLGSVALWLYEHGIDIKIIEFSTYKAEDGIYIEPCIVVPPPVRFEKIGGEGLPLWVKDGKNWHLEKRCSSKTKEMLNTLDQIILDNFDIDDDSAVWKQKHYVAYRVHNYNWLIVITAQNYLRLDFLVKTKAFKIANISTDLDVAKFDAEGTLSEKIGLLSSVIIKRRNEHTDRIYLRVKDDFNLKSKKFLKFLKDARNAFPK
jgi:hypothetical protein